MNAWTEAELDAIGTSPELTIAPSRADGTRRSAVPIWVVRVGADLFIRSYRGEEGAWYRRVRTQGRAHIRAAGIERDVTAAPADPAHRVEIDRAYRTKYGTYGPTYVTPMLADAAAATTLRLVPGD